MTQRLSEDELAQRLAEAATHVAVGKKYRHYKGNSYHVLNIALTDEVDEPCVIYQADYDKRLIFIRPLANWLETVEFDGKTIPRFTKY